MLASVLNLSSHCLASVEAWLEEGPGLPVTWQVLFNAQTLVGLIVGHQGFLALSVGSQFGIGDNIIGPVTERSILSS